ncbi:MAG: WXG100 family type VII secretion target [Lachnospiraceae bacterium]|nr:WXG100 family type VII secretion target [Lachnospiraceae bacterium]
MATNKQQVNATKMKKTGNELNDLSSKIKAEVKKLDEDIKKISSVWSSDAATAYVKKYNQNKANFDQLVLITRQMGEALINFAQNYSQADDKAADLIWKYLGK